LYTISNAIIALLIWENAFMKNSKEEVGTIYKNHLKRHWKTVW